MLTKSRGGAVGDHEARIQASFVDQERWEFAERRIAKTFDAPLADGCQLVHRDRQIIKSLDTGGHQKGGTDTNHH